jgi:hypothetical protein
LSQPRSNVPKRVLLTRAPAPCPVHLPWPPSRSSTPRVSGVGPTDAGPARQRG